MSELEVRQDGAVLTVLFNRPEARNAMTFAMYDGLEEACTRADADDSVRVMVLRGAGGRAFVAGTDISQFSTFTSGEDGIAYEDRISRVVNRLEDVAVPTVAAIEGPCVGGGLALAAACDLRVATESSRFGVPIARTLGNCLSMAGYARLVSMLGPARTKDIVFTARMVGADEALAAGFATEVVAAEEIDARVAELAELLATHAPITLKATKEAIRRIREANLPDGSDLIAEAYGSDDFRQGVAAFLDKRPPSWTGT
jgi:enoyl-CoA hydratase/carnithine racemase